MNWFPYERYESRGSKKTPQKTTTTTTTTKNKQQQQKQAKKTAEFLDASVEFLYVLGIWRCTNSLENVGKATLLKSNFGIVVLL